MSRVIRGKVVPAKVVDATERAAKILDDANTAAAATLAEAHRDATAIRERGLAQGLAEGRLDAAALIVRAQEVLDHARERSEPALVRLAVGAAEQLLGAELTLEPARIRDLVRGVLTRARRARQIVMRVHPEDLPALQQEPALESIALKEDASLDRGDCVIDTDLGRLDGRLAVRVQALVDALQGPET